VLDVGDCRKDGAGMGLGVGILRTIQVEFDVSLKKYVLVCAAFVLGGHSVGKGRK
jgi:hypothetical protein